MLDGILCASRTGCAVRQPSLYFPHWDTVYRRL
ncbi:hypothetical protein EOE48_10995 [Methylobacterium oryzihabitans]|uniref:Uncharacterized protein n=1 Tax=Methylobacterium oryzihabitans TaxID=2499852 RepID=A0A3S2XMJ5_9HYPH|nr:hypothetical protein EOE48_10995 [Methylobacterium oryzihabitans]